MNRRQFLRNTGLMGAGSAMAAGMPSLTSAHIANFPQGKAEHCIFIWLGGGMAQIDTFDPKSLGNSKATPKISGSEYRSIDTAVPGVQFCEHLHQTAKVADRMTVMRTVKHDAIDEHAFATNLVHTGRKTTGSVTYPSIGSIVAHERGAVGEDVPAYMLIGYPNVSRGPGFLGAKGNYVYLTDIESGPAGFARPDGIDSGRARRREDLLKPLQERIVDDSPESLYRAAQEEAMRLAGPDFMRHFDLKDEPDSLRNRYGSEFGQRCLLSRRLVQAGVRFIEVSHNLNFVNGTGWDTHNEGQQNQHLLIQDLDTSYSALIEDLEKQGLLDKTLVVLATEFGRPASFDSRGGRGHQSSAFSMVLAGGGLNHQGAYGVTDDMSKNAVENPVPLADFHATIHAALGINPSRELYDGTRPVPITDNGKPVAKLLA